MQCMECAPGGTYEFVRLDLRVGIGVLACPSPAHLDSFFCTTSKLIQVNFTAKKL